jgi:isoquinoline 1-oxidoreductase subunit beta
LPFLQKSSTSADIGNRGAARVRGRRGRLPDEDDEAPDILDFTDVFMATETASAFDLKIEVKPDNRVYFDFPRMDIGQGVITSTRMMVADNLDVPFENMDTVLSPAEEKRGAYITGGSKNTRVFWEPIRVVCAQMRGQLMAAASQKLGVPVNALRTEDGYVVATDGRKLSSANSPPTPPSCP